MELIAARVTDYKCIIDSGWVEIADLTCFVGQNESGKTAFLEALARLNPYNRSHALFDWLKQYPRKNLESYKLAHELNPATVVRARFRLSSEELADVRSVFGNAVFKQEQPILELQKNYQNKTKFVLNVYEEAVVHHLVSSAAFTDEIVDFNLRKAKTLKELGHIIQSMPSQSHQVRAFCHEHQVKFEGSAACAVYEHLKKRVPTFAFFSDQSTMSDRVALENVSERSKSDRRITPEKLFLALLTHSGITTGDLLKPTNSTELKRKLDAASEVVATEFSRFWSQNPDVSIGFDLSATAVAPDGLTEDDTTEADAQDSPVFDAGALLHLRIHDNRQGVSLALDEQSRGFIWFISFIAQCKLMTADDRPLILLLDEPGASLHQSSQRDLLRFMEERLIAHGHQILVTGQSPLIERSNTKRLRTVEKNCDQGTVIADGRSPKSVSARGQLSLVHSRA